LWNRARLPIRKEKRGKIRNERPGDEGGETKARRRVYPSRASNESEANAHAPDDHERKKVRTKVGSNVARQREGLRERSERALRMGIKICREMDMSDSVTRSLAAVLGERGIPTGKG